ncbi:unnamed protein product, partial [Prorocentrum cordatum]
MASLTAGGIKSMGEIVGGDASATDQSKNTWLHAAAVQSYKTLGKPERFQSDPPAAFVLRDMPLQHTDNVVNVKHLVDWVTLEDGAAEQLDTVDVYDARCGGNYMALPALFTPNKDPGEIAFTVQLCILPEDANGEQCALKYVRFDNKVRADIAMDIFVAGRALTIHWGTLMMDRLGGVHVRHWVQPPVAAAVGGGGYDMEKRRAGYRFMEGSGPRANNRNQFVEWTDEQVNDEKHRKSESLRNYASGPVGARTLERWAITLKRSHPFVFDNIVVPILKSHDVHGAMWIGKTRVGKCAAPKTIGFAISAYQVDKNNRTDLRPSVATTKKIDSLRLEPGTACKPAIADDAALTKWGGASFEQNQSRQICVNPYDQEFEKKVRSIRRGQQAIKFDGFLKIIDRNFAGEKQCGYQMADVEAYMAWSNIVLLTGDWMCLWLASTTKTFTPETTPILKRFKKDQTSAPPDYGVHMKWAVAAMKKLARGEDIGRSRTVRGPALFDQDAPPRYEFVAMDGERNVGADASAAASAAAPPAPAIPGNPDDDDADSGPGGEMRGAAAAEDEEYVFGFGGGMDGDGGPPPPAAVAAAPPSPAAAIKREPGVFRQRLQKSMDCGVIHLDTPTPKKKRTDIEEDLSQMLE